MDVVPADVLGAIEFDQGLAAHVDRLDLSRQAGESSEFGNRAIDLDVLVCPFTLQSVDLIKKRHSRVLLCSRSWRVPEQRGAILWQDRKGFKWRRRSRKLVPGAAGEVYRW